MRSASITLCFWKVSLLSPPLASQSPCKIIIRVFKIAFPQDRFSSSSLFCMKFHVQSSCSVQQHISQSSASMLAHPSQKYPASPKTSSSPLELQVILGMRDYEIIDKKSNRIHLKVDSSLISKVKKKWVSSWYFVAQFLLKVSTKEIITMRRFHSFYFDLQE